MLKPLVASGKGPLMLQLALTDAQAFNQLIFSGGAHASLLFETGLDPALLDIINHLKSIQSAYPAISNADLWSFAGAYAVANSGGPNIKWRPGRSDYQAFTAGNYPGRNPKLLQPTEDNIDNIRSAMSVLGIRNDEDIVALFGARCMASAKAPYDGFNGTWSVDPHRFTNEYFIRLSERFFDTYFPEKVYFNGQTLTQYKDMNGYIMIPSDVALLTSPESIAWVSSFASNQAAFFDTFSHAYTLLSENGVILETEYVDTCLHHKLELLHYRYKRLMDIKWPIYLRLQVY